MQTHTVNQASTRADEQVQCLLLQVGGAFHALDIYAVEEVVRMAALTPKPNAPDWLSGYLNLRGDILPVVDLRRRLGRAAGPLRLNDLIVIVHHAGRRAGLIVDGVSDVVTLSFREGERISRFDDTPVFWLDPAPYVEEAHAQ
ncbi:MAG: purine-binding chemotaxis protein CheW [Caldilineae bacterium]|nr:MAG: purine-binding chemotaxis protein CheW [Caldilineae bacterium]